MECRWPAREGRDGKYMTRETRNKILTVGFMSLFTIGFLVVLYIGLSEKSAQGRINESARTPILIGLPIMIVVMSGFLYAAYYWNWGSKHFDTMPKFFKMFCGSTTRSEYDFFYKASIIATLIFCVILFIFFLFWKW